MTNTTPADLWDAVRDLMNLAAAARRHGDGAPDQVRKAVMGMLRQSEAAALTRTVPRPDDGRPDDLADEILAPPAPGEQWLCRLLEEGAELRPYVRRSREPRQRQAAAETLARAYPDGGKRGRRGQVCALSLHKPTAYAYAWTDGGGRPVLAPKAGQ